MGDCASQGADSKIAPLATKDATGRDRRYQILDRYAKFNGNFVLVAFRSWGLEADGTKELLEIVDDFLIQAVQNWVRFCGSSLVSGR